MDFNKNKNININSNDVILAYSPSDFFWVSADENDFSMESCNLPQCSETDLGSENIQNCYSKELCNNKKNSTLLQKMQYVHSGADGRYFDTTNIYQKTILDTFNLGVGIIIMISLTSKIYFQK